MASGHCPSDSSASPDCIAQRIHSTAMISPGAKIGAHVQIGPNCIIGDEVTIGDHTIIENNVVLQGPLELGEHNFLGPYVTAGLPPQHLGYRGEKTRTIIGNRNVLREYVNIHRGTVQGHNETIIGDDNYLMAFVHVGHDSKVGNRVIIANACSLAGHVTVEDFVNIGGMCGIHQFVRVGEYAMIGGMSSLRQDSPPYTLLEGNPPRTYGLNVIGLRRNGIGPEDRMTLKRVYRILFRSKLPLREALERVGREFGGNHYVDHLIEFIGKSKRGFYR